MLQRVFAMMAMLGILTVVDAQAPVATFKHGVGSGDFDTHSIILWTRVTPCLPDRSMPIEVTYFVRQEGGEYRDPMGRISTHAERDWTVKVNATDLAPLTRYYYKFKVQTEAGERGCGPGESREGTFRIFPSADAPQSQQPSQVRIALFSCSNWGHGYFNAYGLSSMPPLNADIFHHVGDWMYEYRGYPEPEDSVRQDGKLPEYTNTLEEYRHRHRVHMRDEGLQRLMASAPTVAMWDDHDAVANNPYASFHSLDPSLDVAINAEYDRIKHVTVAPHLCRWAILGSQRYGGTDSVGGDEFFERLNASLKAYHEWLPTVKNVIGQNDDTREQYLESLAKYYRYHELGNLGRLIVPETRLWGRTQTDLYGDGLQRLRNVANKNTSYGLVDEAIRKCFRDEGIPLSLPNEIENIGNIESCLTKIRDAVDAFRSNDSKTMLGSEQMQWLEDTVKGNKGMWTVVGQQVVMGDVYPPDYEGVIEEELQRQGNTTKVQKWIDTKEAFRINGTKDPIYCYSNHPKVGCNRLLTSSGDPLLNESVVYQDPARYFGPATQEDREDFIINNIRGRYNITTSFDDWMGYVAERERFLRAIQKDEERDSSNVRNPIVLSGDSHDAWINKLHKGTTDQNNNFTYNTNDYEYVAPEFAGNSVSSPGSESFLLVPYELHNRAHEYSSFTMESHTTGTKGLVLMTLKKDQAIAEYMYVQRDQAIDYNDPSKPLHGGYSPITCIEAFRTTPSSEPGGAPVLETMSCNQETDLSPLKPRLQSSKQLSGSSASNSSGWSAGASAGFAIAISALAAVLIGLAVYIVMLKKKEGGAASRYANFEDNSSRKV